MVFLPAVMAGMFCTVTVITPFTSVVMLLTYWVRLAAASMLSPAAFMGPSQPKLLAAVGAEFSLVWLVSVMLVRHLEAAKMASDTFARVV